MEILEFLENALDFSEHLAVVLNDQQERITTIRALLIDYNLALEEAIDSLRPKRIPVAFCESKENISVRVA